MQLKYFISIILFSVAFNPQKSASSKLFHTATEIKTDVDDDDDSKNNTYTLQIDYCKIQEKQNNVIKALHRLEKQINPYNKAYNNDIDNGNFDTYSFFVKINEELNNIYNDLNNPQQQENVSWQLINQINKVAQLIKKYLDQVCNVIEGKPDKDLESLLKSAPTKKLVDIKKRVTDCLECTDDLLYYDVKRFVLENHKAMLMDLNATNNNTPTSPVIIQKLTILLKTMQNNINTKDTSTNKLYKEISACIAELNDLEKQYNKMKELLEKFEKEHGSDNTEAANLQDGKIVKLITKLQDNYAKNLSKVDKLITTTLKEMKEMMPELDKRDDFNTIETCQTTLNKYKEWDFFEANEELITAGLKIKHEIDKNSNSISEYAEQIMRIKENTMQYVDTTTYVLKKAKPYEQDEQIKETKKFLSYNVQIKFYTLCNKLANLGIKCTEAIEQDNLSKENQAKIQDILADAIDDINTEFHYTDENDGEINISTLALELIDKIKKYHISKEIDNDTTSTDAIEDIEKRYEIAKYEEAANNAKLKSIIERNDQENEIAAKQDNATEKFLQKSKLLSKLKLTPFNEIKKNKHYYSQTIANSYRDCFSRNNIGLQIVNLYHNITITIILSIFTFSAWIWICKYIQFRITNNLIADILGTFGLNAEWIAAKNTKYNEIFYSDENKSDAISDGRINLAFKWKDLKRFVFFYKLKWYKKYFFYNIGNEIDKQEKIAQQAIREV